MKYVIALDQGTTSSRAALFDENAHLLDITQSEFKQIFPKSGWVEHNPEELWESQYKVFEELIKKNNVDPKQILSIGITNQRETTIVWDRQTGKPLHNAIVWQDKRTAPICERIKSEGLSFYIKENTGLVVDSYFSATKLMWILDQVDGAREKAEKGQLCFGTVDTWLIWKLTEGRSFVTDYTNASRTMLFNINKLKWDDFLLHELKIHHSLLPEALPSAGNFGEFRFKGATIKIQGVAGDQQAALFGQACFEKGQAKNTYGTGCFLLMNTGDEAIQSDAGLVTTIACQRDGSYGYALEGSIFIAGAAVQWLRDGLKIIQSAKDTEAMAEAAGDDHGLVVVPAFNGLGAPYWDPNARGAIFGLSRGSDQNHLVRATLEALAYQTKDVLEAMQQDAEIKLKELKVDGGAASNNFLMQFQADMLGVAVERPGSVESTVSGAAYLAGIAAGIWEAQTITANRKVERVFEPQLSSADRKNKYRIWKKAVTRSMNWGGE